MANKLYDNFFLENEIEDQYNSLLNLQQFCTVDNTLVTTEGMKKLVHVYSATDGTEKLTMGQGNSKDIEVTYSEVEYNILLAQNRFPIYDEENMTDAYVYTTGTKHMAVDMFNTVNADIFAEFNKATLTVSGTTPNFDVFADAVSLLNIEYTDNDPSIVAPRCFAFLCPKDVAKARKALKDELKYVEAFVRAGYVGTVAGVNLYTKKDAVENTICLGTKEAVTLFNKTGTQVEQLREPDVRKTTLWSRKYYLAALTDATKAVKITLGATA